MTTQPPLLISVDLPLGSWRFIRDILLALKRAAEQPHRPYEHRSHTLRLIDQTPDAYPMLQDACYTIAETIAAEAPATEK